MRKLVAFESVTMDGYFSGANGDLSWAHRPEKDAEFESFIAGNAQGGGVLVWGRKTYEMMKSYWPTEAARKNDPAVAERMNQLPKIVFSKTLEKADWNNTKVLKGDLPAEMRQLKNESGDEMVILGSGSIVSQLAQESLIDEYQFVVVPVVLGQGRTLFEGTTKKIPMKLKSSRMFRNGNVFLTYEPRLN
ncbi:MAG TPA: dihydrofolate reductase family protein [bacterium]|nr:dihydrofolate reductase family protein [bacterium]